MYNINMYGVTSNWWQQQQNKERSKIYNAPSKCSFCNIEIKDGDFFYAGYDAHGIYAETCDNIRCHTWLKNKVRIKKWEGKNYLKEAEEREKDR